MEPIQGLRSAIAATLRTRRRDYGIAQEALADKVGLNRSYIGTIERGMQTPSLEVIFGIARGLEVEPWMLVKEIQENLDSM